MQLKLGKKTYTTKKLTGAALWESLEFEEELKKEEVLIKKLNMMAEQVIKLYDNQFEIKDIQDGLNADEVWQILNLQCFGVGIKMAKKIQTKND